jgi:hypothetical protein
LELLGWLGFGIIGIRSGWSKVSKCPLRSLRLEFLNRKGRGDY